MNKDGRHDGRRRGAGQHRLGPRVGYGGDGRERSGSNSSGSSHGGGKNKNAPINALKVTGIKFRSFSVEIGDLMVASDAFVQRIAGLKLLLGSSRYKTHFWDALTFKWAWRYQFSCDDHTWCQKRSFQKRSLIFFDTIVSSHMCMCCGNDE